MKSSKFIVSHICWIGALVAPLAAQTPTVIEYTGRVAVDGETFASTEDAPGYFKCILVTGAEPGDTIWSNDGITGAAAGSSSNGSEPMGVASPPERAAAIRLEDGSATASWAVQGQFSLRLGSGLNPITSGILDNSEGNVYSDVRLRVWFSPDGEDLFPEDEDRAYQQLEPDVQLGSVPFAIWAAQAERVKNGGISPEQLRDGEIDKDWLADGAVIAGKLAHNAVTTDNIVTGAITGDKLSGIPVSKISPAFAQEQWSDLGPSELSFNSETGIFTAAVTFDQAFDSAPLVEAVDWSVSNVSATGFTATSFGEIEASSRVVVPGSHRDFSFAVVDGRPAAVYSEFSGGTLKYAIADDASGETWGASVVVDNTVNAGFHPSLAVVNGRPAVSYQGYPGPNLKFAIADDSTGNGTWSSTTVDATGDVGEWSSLASVNGLPAISYFDRTNGALKFAIADSGGNWTARSVDDGQGSSVGWYSSLVEVDGKPAISYADPSNGQLKYAIAADAIGLSWPSANIKVVDDNVNIIASGTPTSLVVVAGFPAICYHSAEDSNLKYVRAADATGGDWETPVVVDGDASSGADLAVLSGRPGISYRGWDSATNVFKYVTAADPDGGSWNEPINVHNPDFISTPSTTNILVLDGQPLFGFNENNVGLRITAFLPKLGDGGWTASDPNQNPYLAVRAAGVADGAVNSSSFAADVGVWFRTGMDVYRDSGRVGIGTSSPSADLSVNGTADNLTGTWGMFSDRRLKENIAPLVPGSLERLLRLDGVSYDYARPDLREGYAHPHRGWIAQDVEKVFPEWVSEAPDGMKMVTPVGFRALTVEALRELRAEKNTAETRLTAQSLELKREGAQLKHRLEQLEEAVRRLSGSPAPGALPPRERDPAAKDRINE